MLISKIEFGSFFTYCPRKDEGPKSQEIKKSKNVMINLKNENSIGNPPNFMSISVSERIKKDIANLPFKDFFGENVELVPVPKSSLTIANSLWVPEKIAKALADQKLGKFYPCLQRFQAVSKSSNSTVRPKAKDHFNSIKLNPLIDQPREIVLIDDVITRGATMLGCASILRRHYPEVKIRGFAVIRTISSANDFNSIIDPCIGEVTLSRGESYRNP